MSDPLIPGLLFVYFFGLGFLSEYLVSRERRSTEEEQAMAANTRPHL